MDASSTHTPKSKWSHALMYGFIMAVLYVPAAMRFMPGLQNQPYAAGSLVIFGIGVLAWRWPVHMMVFWVGIASGASLVAILIGSTDTYSPAFVLMSMGLVTGIPLVCHIVSRMLTYVWNNA